MIKYIALALAASCTSVIAQEPICGPSVEVWEALRGYGEERQSVGMNDTGTALVETWGNTDSGTWTILMTSPRAESCVIAHGSGFSLQAQVEGEPA